MVTLLKKKVSLNMMQNMQLTELMTPLSIVPITIDTAPRGPSSANPSCCWSPFSAPNFSPYSASKHPVNQQSGFQYSMPIQPFYSPNPVRRQFHHNRGGYQNQENRGVSCSSSNSSMTVGSPRLPARSEKIDMSEYITRASWLKQRGQRVRGCQFCKANNETELVYSSHSLKDSNGQIVCPVLLNYQCPICHATGVNAHTKKYCPVLQRRYKEQLLHAHKPSSN